MSKKYNQLSQEQRYQIYALLKAGKSQTFIANQICCHKSTVSRELKRNVPQRGQGAKTYDAEKAHQKTVSRHQKKNKIIYFSNEMKKEMMELLEKERYSPELISHYWRKKYGYGVSYETIYKFIWNCKHTNIKNNRPFKMAYKFLKHGKRRRKRGNYKDSRGLIPNRVPIAKRPKIVEKRKRFGDIEVDLIMGANNKSALLVTVDRCTLHTTLSRLKGKDANIITNKIIKKLKKYKAKIHTLTFDNDQAFSMHEKIAKALQVKTYFTRPYTSQDKGTIENRNGVIRLFFPKKTDFNLIDDCQIKDVENKINNRPIRKYNYLSAKDLLFRFAG